jgi:putative redox protein
MNVITTHKGKLKFEAKDESGHIVSMDAPLENGGDGSAIGPKKLLLAGLAGCTGMDVVSILKKMHVDFDEFYMVTDAELTEEHPQVFIKIMLEYHFKGKDLPLEKLEHAVDLSHEKYCGVSAMLSVASPIVTTVIID